MNLNGKRVLVTGGTGSLGQVLVRRLLSGERGLPKKVIVLSRDEARQHEMRLSYLNRQVSTDEVIYRNFEQALEFRIGDVFTMLVLNLQPEGMEYGFRFDGPFDPTVGHRFDSSKIVSGHTRRSSSSLVTMVRAFSTSASRVSKHFEARGTRAPSRRSTRFVACSANGPNT